MEIHSELKSTLIWTAVTAVPLAPFAFYLGNIHGGPGGYYFFVGMALLLPTFLVGGALSQAVPTILLVLLLLVVQFAYWGVFVFGIRMLWRWRQNRGERIEE